MERKQKIILIVILSIVLFLAIILIGITYAFFTANNPEGSTAQIISDTGRMLITYNDGTDNIVPVTDIQPSNKILVNKTFTLTGSNTTVGLSSSDGLTMSYRVGLKYKSTFSDGMIHYYIKEIESDSDADVTANFVVTPEDGKTDADYINQTIPGNDTYTGYVHGTLLSGSKYFEMVSGEFPAKIENQKITFNLIIQFPDNNENQDSEKGKTFNGKIVINYEPKYISTYLTKLDKTENGLEIDDTSDENLRYVGASPKNYVTFNNETWRIIGVFNNITTIDDNGNEKTESLAKIVRNESLGEYSWDSSLYTFNNGYGINEWSQADLMTELNTDYINTKITSGTTKWYNAENNTKTANYDYSKNIKSSSIDKIANVRWNIGGVFFTGNSVLDVYKQERGTTVIGYTDDGVTRTISWDGKIALMYPSDYGYASTNITCRNDLSVNDTSCINSNWLFNNANQWTLSPFSDNEISAIYIDLDGYVYETSVVYNRNIRPTLFLKSNVVVAGGTGSETDPFIIG